LLAAFKMAAVAPMSRISYSFTPTTIYCEPGAYDMPLVGWRGVSRRMPHRGVNRLMPHPVIRCMGFVYWRIKTTDTHSEHVILIAFADSNGYTNARQYYVIRTSPHLSKFSPHFLLGLLSVLLCFRLKDLPCSVNAYFLTTSYPPSLNRRNHTR